MNSRLKCNRVMEEYLVGGMEGEALSGGVVVALHEVGEAVWRERIEVGFFGQEAAHTTDRVFDAALLPGRVGVTKPSRNAKPSGEEIVLAELGSVIEGHGVAGMGRHGDHQGTEIVGDRLGRSGFLPHQQRAPRSAFVGHEQELPRFAEAHEVNLPIAGAGPLRHHGGTIMNGNPVQNGFDRPSAILPTLSATVLLARQAAMQRLVERPSAPINVAIDRFIADPTAGGILGQTSGNLLGRPALREAAQNFLTKFRLAFELVRPTAGMPPLRQRLGALGMVAAAPLFRSLAVALQFTADRRNAALQNSGDEALRFTVSMETVNLNPLRQDQLLILSFFHRNTFVRCCT